jgi:hypothetical protein
MEKLYGLAHRGASPGEAADEQALLAFLDPPAKSGHLGRLGRYEVTAVLGWGGMGVVLKAVDATLRRLVAIKVIAPRLAANAAARQRFLREAQAAAAIRHEHVVTIHAVEEARGSPYNVMEYVPGMSLQERINRAGPLPLHEVLRIGMQTASGLAAAHALGVIHRDIKPANILLERGSGRVKITDFGLARAVDDPGLTQNGTIVGTPEYMAPEQARGEAQDQRADLFSLGSVLYAMCTGRSPFRAATSLAVLRRVSEETPVPIAKINPEMPGWLVRVIARLHAKDPADRFGSAEEVAALLGGYLAAPPRTSTRTARPWVVAGVLSVLLLAIAGVAAGLCLAFGSDSPADPKENEDGWALFVGAAMGKDDAGGAAAAPPRVKNADLRLALVGLKAANAHTRLEAATRLENMVPIAADRRAVARTLEPLLNDPEHFPRLAMIRALGVWGRRENVPALIKMFEHKDVFTRRAAIMALGKIKDERSAEAIAGRLEDALNRHSASQALQEMGRMAEKAVAQRIGHDDWMIRLEVCKILKVIGTKRSIAALEKGVQDANGIVANEARAALEAIKGRS